MKNPLSKKIILCLLDCVPKSAKDIANDIGESWESVANQLTMLVSERVCEETSPHEIGQYAVCKDIEILTKLAKEFLSNLKEHKKETEQFITSEYYFSAIDNHLVNYALTRFSLDSINQSDSERETLRRILIVSPSALLFALHGGTKWFSGLWSRIQLDSLDETRTKNMQFLLSQFQTLLLEKLVADMKMPTFKILTTVLQLRAAKISIEVNLAAPHANYIKAIGKGYCTVSQVMEMLGTEQWGMPVNPMDLSNDGLALLQLEEFQAAIEIFNKALNLLENPTHKATVLNNKGVAFLRCKQYQKAVGCFEDGIKYHSGNEVPQLRENIQLASEYLARATDADNLNEPTQIRFVQGYPVPFEETLFYEFKEITGSNPARSIANDSDEYAVAFLNGKGGRIFWGIRDSDRITVGVFLDEQHKDEIRTQVSQKLWSIRPPIVDGDWHFKFHNAYDLQEQTIGNLWVIELVIAPPREKNVFYTNSGDLFVKTEGGKQKLLGPQVTQFIRNFLENNAETD